MEVGLGPGVFVFDGDPSTTRTEDTPTTTQFLAYVYCGQTAGWTKTLLGTEVDLGAGHIVLDGVPALRERGTAASPTFSAHVYCGHGGPSQLLLSSCTNTVAQKHATNYRPMSLTSVCSKEHIIYSNVCKHLEHHGILTPPQHGFRPGFSCTRDSTCFLY